MDLIPYRRGDIFTQEDLLAGKVFLVDKPLDWTSFDVVNKIRWKLRKEFHLKKIKVGHAGTLDPKATGLLILCAGKATKSIPEIQDAEKEYRATLKLGFTTESYDTEKPEINPRDISEITEAQIQEVLKAFVGEQEQYPPIFSAVKIDGKRAYDLARSGHAEIAIKPRKIHIRAIENVEIELPFVSFDVVCTKGTYIRSLAHDMGQKLGVGAYLAALRRTRIGEFKVADAEADFLQDDFRFQPHTEEN